MPETLSRSNAEKSAPDDQGGESAARPQPRPAVVEAARLRPKVAIVGTGFIADYHMEILREMAGVEVMAACDPDAARLEAFCRRWGIQRRAASVEELLVNHRPDVAHVLVPPALHYPTAKSLLAEGVHVLLEKPMALRRSDAQELAQLAQSKSACLGVNHNWLHQPLFQRALEDIAARKIGSVKHVVSINSLPLFQLSAGLHDHWMFDEPTNILFEQGVHPLSQICQLIGEASDVQLSCADPQTLRGDRPFFANWQVALQGKRATAQMLLAFGSIFPEVRLSIIGQDGAIHIDQLKNFYTLDRRTQFIDPGDRFVRAWRTARGMAVDAARGLLEYGLSLFRIIGRRDVYYLGMKKSLEAYYRCVAGLAPSDALAVNGLQTISTLEQIVDRYRALPTPPPPAPAPRRSVANPVHSRLGKVVVFGASGFIGRKVVQRLAAAGVEQRLFVRNPKRAADLAQLPNAEVFVGDVANPEQVHRAVEGCETIIHLVAGAADDWQGFERLFIEGLRNVAEAALAHKSQRLLFASSITSLFLGRAGEVITADTKIDGKLNKRCHYAKAKILCERMLLEMHRSSGLPAVILRPGIVVGGGAAVQHLGVGEWPSETTCIRWGRNLDGELPLVLVDDVAEAFYAAAAADIHTLAGTAHNLVGDVRLSSQEYVEIIRRETNRDFQVHPQSVAYWTLLELGKWAIKAAARKPGNTRLTWHELAYRTGAASFDCSAAKAVLDWRPVADREQFIERGIRAALRGTV